MRRAEVVLAESDHPWARRSGIHRHDPWAVGMPVSTEAGSLPARMTQRPRVATRLGALYRMGATRARP